MSNTYKIREIFGPTIQGEGQLTGAPCYFIRFAGCNMWNGRIKDRANSNCPYCDTDFLDGEKMTIRDIIDKLKGLSFETRDIAWVIISGGEPLLQLDVELVDALHNEGYAVQVETNGTIAMKADLEDDIDSVSMSPKLPIDETKIEYCDSLKVLYPHPNPEITPENFAEFPAGDYFVQPIDILEFGEGFTIERFHEECKENLRKSINKVQQLGTPWKLGMQMHKVIDVQ